VTPRYGKLVDTAGRVFGWENMELISGERDTHHTTPQHTPLGHTTPHHTHWTTTSPHPIISLPQTFSQQQCLEKL